MRGREGERDPARLVDEARAVGRRLRMTLERTAVAATGMSATADAHLRPAKFDA
jgi:hypothetical protein